MKYLVTGATGFIGGAVVRQLRAAGHDVVAVVRDPGKAQDLIDQEVIVHQGDITDKASLREPMTDVDGVFHLAAWYAIGIRDVGRMERINVEGTRNVLELMRELDIPKGVYTSTVGVFSNTRGRLVDETYRYDGPFLNHYERTKWIAHYEVAEPMMRDGLPLVIVMPGLVYGPGDPSITGEQMRQYLRGKLHVAPLGAAYCWGHVDDTACGHLLAMEKGIPGETYIIAGEPASFLDVLKIGEAITGVPVPRLRLSPGMMKVTARLLSLVEKVVPLTGTYSAEGIRTLAGVTYYGSNEKARRELGLVMRPLADGLRETARYEMDRLGIG
jgi:dihydroflavonol-4-reductase